MRRIRPHLAGKSGLAMDVGNAKRCIVLGLLGLAAILAAPAVTAGQALVREEFEGATPSFAPLAADTQFQTRCHARMQANSHSGQSAEFIEIAAAHGTYVYYGMPVGPAAVIPDLKPSIWVKAPRGGVQLLARVILPNAPHPETGEPLHVLVRGDIYRQAGNWQRLQLYDLPQLVERQARLLRFEHQVAVETKGAYLDQIVINVFSAPGINQVWIDDLELPGLVEPTRAPVERAAWAQPQPRPTQRKVREVHRSGMQLLVDGKPIFPRIIEHRGEPLAMLRQMGFTGVKLHQPPSRALLDEAAVADMWIVCPPPAPQSDGRSLTVATIGPEYEPVLVWDLGENLTGGEFDRLAQWAELVRRADRHLARPLMCDALTDLRMYSRHVDMLRPFRRPLGSSLELVDYLTWLRERPRLARPGTPIWTTIQTQPNQAVADQVRLLADNVPPPAIRSEQLQLLAHTAVAAGARGLVFESHQRLDGDDPATKARRAMLELLNLELELIEPWISSGTLVTTLTSPDGEIRATLLQLQRSRLLLPLWLKRGAQYSTGQSATNGVSLIVPGVPDSNQAFEILPTSLRPVDHKRVTGGVRVTLPEFGLTSAVLLTQDPLEITSMSRSVARYSERSAQLLTEVAQARLAETEQLARQLGQAGQQVHLAWISAAHGKVKAAQAALAGQQWELAYLEASRAMRPLRVMERHYWDAAWQEGGAVMTDPLLVSGTTYPGHWALMQRLKSAKAGANRLPGGDCENRERMVSSGWKHVQHPQDGLESSAELVPGTPRSGRFSLRMRVWPQDAENPPELVESPPIWITSAPVEVRAGEMVRIRGYVRVPAPVVGNVDGLMIIDSLTGPALAERIALAEQWREFTLIRVAPRDEAMTVTFALTGIGEAWIDDVTIEPLELPAPAPAVVTGPGGTQLPAGYNRQPGLGGPPYATVPGMPAGGYPQQVPQGVYPTGVPTPGMPGYAVPGTNGVPQYGVPAQRGTVAPVQQGPIQRAPVQQAPAQHIPPPTLPAGQPPAQGYPSTSASARTGSVTPFVPRPYPTYDPRPANVAAQPAAAIQAHEPGTAGPNVGSGTASGMQR